MYPSYLILSHVTFLNTPLRWAGYPFNNVFIKNTLWKCAPQNSEPRATNRSSQMQQNQLIMDTFQNFLTLLNKHKNANIKNVTVFIFLPKAMIKSFLVHFFLQTYNFFCPSEFLSPLLPNHPL